MAGHTNQQWWGGGSYQVKSSINGNKCIDLYAGDTTPGRRIEIWDCISGLN
jgi:hypothetical protein